MTRQFTIGRIITSKADKTYNVVNAIELINKSLLVKMDGEDVLMVIRLKEGREGQKDYGVDFVGISKGTVVKVFAQFEKGGETKKDDKRDPDTQMKMQVALHHISKIIETDFKYTVPHLNGTCQKYCTYEGYVYIPNEKEVNGKMEKVDFEKEIADLERALKKTPYVMSLSVTRVDAI